MKIYEFITLESQ